MRRTQAVWLGLALVGVIGCDSSTSSPSEPQGTPLAVVEGQLLPEEVLFEPIPVGDGDTVLIRVDNFTVVEGDPPIFDLLLGIGVGVISSTTGDCVSTSSRLLAVGDDWVVHLGATNYCLNIFDPGVLVDESVSEYRVLLYDAF